MDPEARALERRLAANPRDIEAGRRLAALDRRTRKTFQGRTVEEGAGGLAGHDHEGRLASLRFLRALGARACEETPRILPLLKNRKAELRVAAVRACAALLGRRIIEAAEDRLDGAVEQR